MLREIRSAQRREVQGDLVRLKDHPLNFFAWGSAKNLVKGSFHYHQAIKDGQKAEKSRRSGSNSGGIAISLIYNGVIIQTLARAVLCLWPFWHDKSHPLFCHTDAE